MTLDIKKAAALAGASAGVSYGVKMAYGNILPPPRITSLKDLMLPIGGGVAAAYVMGYTGTDKTTSLMVAGGAAAGIHGVQHGFKPLEPLLVLAAGGAVAFWAGCELDKMLKSTSA